MRKTIIIGLLFSFVLLAGCISPPKKVEVPNLIGMEVESAIELVESKSLNPDALKGEAAPEENLEDIVYWQAPNAGTRVKKGSIVNFIFYDEIVVEVRKMAILGTCLPGCEHMWRELGAPHYNKLLFYGNAYDWPNYNLVEQLGMKVFININAEEWRFSTEEQEELSQLRNYVKRTLTEAKLSDTTEALVAPRFETSFRRYKDLLTKSIPNEGEIQRAVNAWKNRPGCGGYWCDSIGHEPDICGPQLESRREFYRLVRKYDPDGIQARPVMEMFNMTEFDDQDENWPYPGWHGAFPEEEDTFDVVAVDCYPGTTNIEETIRWAWEKFVKKYCKKKQVIIQMQAFNYEPGMIWTQYNTWKELFASDEWDNPYKSPMGVCWYKDETVRQSPEMQQEIAEVIADAMR